MAHRQRAFFIRWNTVLHSKDLLSPWGSLTYAIHRPPRLAALNGSKSVSSLVRVFVNEEKFFGFTFRTVKNDALHDWSRRTCSLRPRYNIREKERRVARLTS
jgi:hypothetical protein